MKFLKIFSLFFFFLFGFNCVSERFSCEEKVRENGGVTESCTGALVYYNSSNLQETESNRRFYRFVGDYNLLTCTINAQKKQACSKKSTWFPSSYGVRVFNSTLLEFDLVNL